jgi:hypothetical protein
MNPVLNHLEEDSIVIQPDPLNGFTENKFPRLIDFGFGDFGFGRFATFCFKKVFVN